MKSNVLFALMLSWEIANLHNMWRRLADDKDYIAHKTLTYNREPGEERDQIMWIFHI